MKKAVEKVNKHNFNGRPLKVKEVLELPLKFFQKSRETMVKCAFS